MASFASLAALLIAAVIVEKLIERFKEMFPTVVHGWRTSLLALALGALIAFAVPGLRLLSILYAGEDVEPYGDLVVSALAIAAGSGFIASVENSLTDRRA